MENSESQHQKKKAETQGTIQRKIGMEKWMKEVMKKIKDKVADRVVINHQDSKLLSNGLKNWKK